MAVPTFHRDPYRRHMVAEVIACRLEGDRHVAVTRDTLLFPGGGGQPADHGTLAEQTVLEVCHDADRGWLHLLAAPVPTGPARMALDWERRFDHMQQHSAQHLITALAQDHFGLVTTAFHLGAERSSIDLDPPAPGPDALLALCDLVNAEIRRALPITARWAEPGEFEALAVRTRGLPEGHEGPVRIVSIEGVDHNTCGGTHVAGTAELQIVQFVGTERVHGATTRLHYLAGGRARRLLDAAQEREHALGRLLACAAAEQVEAVERILGEQRVSQRALRAAREDLAGALAASLALGVRDGAAALHREEDDLAFLQAVAGQATKLAPEALLLLTAGADAGCFLLAGPADAVARLGPALCALFDGRGGGARGRFQGRVQRLDRRDEALALLTGGGCRGPAG